jgi:hypothetical protein
MGRWCVGPGIWLLSGGRLDQGDEESEDPDDVDEDREAKLPPAAHLI